jgi:hypothetical protein
MRTGVLLAVVVLLLLGVGAFFLIGPSASRGRPGDTREPVARAPSRESPELTPARTPEVPQGRADAPSEREALPPQLEAAAVSAPGPSETRWPTVRILVLDPAQRPVAKVPVSLYLEIGGSSYDLTRSTGDDGLAVYEQVGKDLFDPIENAVVRARIVGTFRTPVASEPWTVDWPTEPVVLILPPSGSVVVEVRDATGVALSTKKEVTLEADRVREAGTHLWRGDLEAARAWIEDGQARFAPVEVGLSLRARIDARPEHGRGEVAFPGPAKEGQEVRALLVPDQAPAVLVLRFLAPDGRPLADAEVETSWTRRMEGALLMSGGTPRRTDPSGRRRITVDEPWREGSTVELLAEHRPSSAESWTATLDLSRSFPPGETDLGDLMLLPEEVLVSGRVVDEEGQGVSAFTARIEHSSGRGQAGSQHGDADGAFAFHGAAPFAEMQLRIDPDGYVAPEAIPFTPGTRGLEIVVRRGGGLVGSLQPVPGLRFDDLFVVARDEIGNTVGDGTIGADGTFELVGLPGGVLNVVFGSRPIEGDVLEVPGVRVTRGERQSDPRLQDLDLSDHLRVVRLTVGQADGLAAASGWVRPVRREKDPIAFVIEEGVARVLTRPEPIDLEVNVPGHRIVLLERVSTDQEVVLEPAFEVTLRVPDSLELPPEGTRLEVGLRRLDTEFPRPNSLALMRGGRQAGWWSGTFRDGDTAFSIDRGVHFSVQETGSFDVSFYLISGSPEGGQIAYEIDATSDLDIGPSDSGRTFVIEPDPEAYAQRRGG